MNADVPHETTKPLFRTRKRGFVMRPERCALAAVVCGGECALEELLQPGVGHRAGLPGHLAAAREDDRRRNPANLEAAGDALCEVRVQLRDQRLPLVARSEVVDGGRHRFTRATPV